MGLVTGVCLASTGHEVTCIDVNEDRVNAVNRGDVPFYEPGLQEIIQAELKTGRLQTTTSLPEAVSASEMTIIAVGTPPRGTAIDLTQVETAAREIGEIIKESDAYHVVVVKSTVVPGTTANLVGRVIAEASGKAIGEFGLCMNPEFLREGSAVEDFQDPDRIVIGEFDAKSGQRLAEVYASFDCPKIHMTLQNAELTKYTSNTLLATLVSFSNEIASLCEGIPDTDVDTIMNALHLDRRLMPRVDGKLIRPGILTYLWAGSGFGGSCLPKDVNALRAFARERQLSTPLLDAVIHVNQERPKQVLGILDRELGGLAGRRITVLGLAFKPGTDDVRASPAIEIVNGLLLGDAKVRVYDPMVPSTHAHGLDDRVQVMNDPDLALEGADGAIIATGWPDFIEWDWSQKCSKMKNPLIVDGRNALRGVSWPANANYKPIGTL